jgi:hypothetical protein
VSPTWLSGNRGSATAVAYVSLSAVALVADCNQQVVRPSIQEVVRAHPTSDSGLCTGGLVGGSNDSSDLASSLALLLS